MTAFPALLLWFLFVNHGQTSTSSFVSGDTRLLKRSRSDMNPGACYPGRMPPKSGLGPDLAPTLAATPVPVPISTSISTRGG
eukprot:CAMPEP_0118885630 /NCGR_PEP_ID=MMETSP1163-20130328/24026_1 /TAXON_ID=124430 /ORGANISM="Phaeomonas parva, Strain CCMP2877" /LENGTH=81 /DNA_ID=CAMNT_0006823679 /DNA_START=473 /DNA_END=715 /DNA_ORIENTATION=+